MRAVVIREFGPIENIKVEEFPAPVPGPDEILIDVHAASVNFPDVLMIEGKYQLHPPRPFVLGREAAGVVAGVGANVTRLRPGMRVTTCVDFGAFGEQCVAPADRSYPIPDSMDYVQAAAFPLTFQTAYVALMVRGQFKAGETVLVTGASGGVGLAAVQIAKAQGATVLAAVSNAEKGRVALANGADHVIDTSVPNLREALREQVRAVNGGRGADIVLEQVGGDVFDASLRALAWSGRLVVVGFAGGRIPEIKANYLLVKNIAVVGLQITDYRGGDPARMQTVQRELFDWFEQGRIRPHVMATLPIERFAEGVALLRERKVQGKVVLKLR